ncbi:MAG: nucleotidyltransferase family protein [Proteobacteria bacterium]|nr:nucleotidyltransferase family protein [Pseudomonadota bacterium]
MKATGHSIIGIILAAGASERMGSPKANLETAGGETLLDLQRRLLVSSGCEGVIAVVGADAAAIRERNSSLDVKWIENSGWRDGQFSSLVRGIEGAIEQGASGAVVLPVDSAGVRGEVVASLIETALRNPHLDAVVPEHEGRRGHPVWLSRNFCESLAALDPKDSSSRLDARLKESRRTIYLPVGDPNICRNINTPDDWKEFEKIRP